MMYSGRLTTCITISVLFIPHLLGLVCAASSSQDISGKAWSPCYRNSGASWMTLSALERAVKRVNWQGFALTQTFNTFPLQLNRYR